MNIIQSRCLSKDKIAVLYPKDNVIKIIKFYNLDKSIHEMYGKVEKEIKLEGEVLSED